MALFLKSFPRHLLTHALYNDIVNDENRSYYFVAGRTKQWDNGPTVPDIETENVADINKFRNDMIIGVRVRSDDAAFLIPRNTWTYGTVYSNFSDDQHSTPYFVVNSVNDIYKVVSNNNGAQSLSEPTARITDATFKTADGYIWKYISTITSDQLVKFSSLDKIPLVSNTDVKSAAIPGTIDAVSLVSVGTQYLKYASGTVLSQIANTVIRVAGTTEEGANFYANTSLYITSGLGVGTLVTLAGSISNSSGNYLISDSTINVNSTSAFLISPRVNFDGDGTGAQAYATVDNGGISTIVVTSIGSNYTYANVTIPDTLGLAANCKPHISPITGHGSDVYAEFNVTSIALAGEFPVGIHETFPDDITFYQFGLLESPLKTNEAIATGNTLVMSSKFHASNGIVFDEGETVVGLSSNAKGRVFKSNTTATYLSYVSGTFTENELVQGMTDNNTTFIEDVVNHDYLINSGTVLYYSNQTAINRSNTTISENIRCVFDLEG